MYWKDFDLFTNWDLHKSFFEEYKKDLSSDNLLKLDHAINLVSKLHDESRMDGTGNMKVHLLRVARVLIEELEERDVDLVLIALMHDVLEDTDYPAIDIEKNFGKRVLQGVQLLTRPRERDWKEYAEEVALKDPQVFKVKISDKLDNARSHSLSSLEVRRQKDYIKTSEIMIPLLIKYAPQYKHLFDDVLENW